MKSPIRMIMTDHKITTQWEEDGGDNVGGISYSINNGCIYEVFINLEHHMTELHPSQIMVIWKFLGYILKHYPETSTQFLTDEEEHTVIYFKLT